MFEEDPSILEISVKPAVICTYIKKEKLGFIRFENEYQKNEIEDAIKKSLRRHFRKETVRTDIMIPIDNLIVN